jgi:hypothetical protein
MIITLDVKFAQGEIVILRTDEDMSKRVCYGYDIAGNNVIYKLACGTMVSNHFEFEIMTEKEALI